MAFYNTGKFYNRGSDEDGFFYNNAVFIFQLNLTEVIKINDDAKLNLAAFIMNETYNWADSLALAVLHLFNGNLIFENEKGSYAALFEVLDKFNITDKFANLIVKHSLSQDMKFAETFKQVSDILATEKINIKEIPTINALISSIDEFGTKELVKSLSEYFQYGFINISDKEPRMAASDFYVTNNNDGMPNIIMPFELYIDEEESIMSFIPEAVDTVVNLDGVDGEIVTDTVYKSRLFNILAYSMDGMTIPEKEEIKSRVSYILNAIKKETKIITFADKETSFDVKYSGAATAKNYSSFVKFELPLKSANSYGYKQFIFDFKGSGLITNNGDKETGSLHKITGLCVNPSFTIGNTLVAWTGTIKYQETLVIDMENQTCYFIDSNGSKQNASKGFNKKYVKIPVGSTVLQANSNTERFISTEWREWVLY